MLERKTITTKATDVKTCTNNADSICCADRDVDGQTTQHRQRRRVRCKKGESRKRRQKSVEQIKSKSRTLISIDGKASDNSKKDRPEMKQRNEVMMRRAKKGTNRAEQNPLVVHLNSDARHEMACLIRRKQTQMLIKLDGPTWTRPINNTAKQPHADRLNKRLNRKSTHLGRRIERYRRVYVGN